MTAPLFAAFLLLLLPSCSSTLGDGDYQCATLVSSSQERFYVKTYSWGLTGDRQLSTLSRDDTPIGFEDKGSPLVVEGLAPFIYRFANDTLTLYSPSPLPSFPLHGSSIIVRYELVDNACYMDLQLLTGHKPYYRVPN